MIDLPNYQVYMENMVTKARKEAMATMVPVVGPENKVRKWLFKWIELIVCNNFSVLGPRGLPGFPGPQGLVGPAGEFNAHCFLSFRI